VGPAAHIVAASYGVTLALAANLADRAVADALSPGEAGLLRELLERLSMTAGD
jgi:hypothetical protein